MKVDGVDLKLHRKHLLSRFKVCLEKTHIIHNIGRLSMLSLNKSFKAFKTKGKISSKKNI